MWVKRVCIRGPRSSIVTGVELYNDSQARTDPAHGDTMVNLDGSTLSLSSAGRVVFAGERVRVDATARERAERSQRAVARIVSQGKPVYGINTGLGRLSDRSVSDERLRELQHNIIRSHAAAVGDPLPEEAVRAILLFRVNSLLKGNSGIRMEVVDCLVDLLNARIHPVVPAQGSVGSSGDLAPLAHLALVILGEGEAVQDGVKLPGKEALARVGRDPLTLFPKEGLALVNGTQYMSGLGYLAYARGERLLRAAVIAAALSLEALTAFSAPLDERVHAARPHAGQVDVARWLRELLSGSRLLDTAQDDVQDAYSLRCIPQVLGPAVEALSFLETKLVIEVNASTDNPLVFPDGAVLSGGNFHGEILGLALEMATMALAEVGSLAERRIDRLLASPGRGLPPFLAHEPGLESGLMVAQYTAAALVSENKVLCHPAVVDSIPTSGGKEDHNSMGSISARKALAVLDNLERVIGVEFLCAAQALDFRGVDGMAPRTRKAYERVRSLVVHVACDRPLSSDIERLAAAVRSGEIVDELL